MEDTINTKVTSRKIRRNNERLYPIYRMFSADFLFYYAIEFLFLTQAKSISAADIIFASSIYGIFRIFSQIPAMIIVERFGKRNGIILGNISNIIYMILIISCNGPGLLFAAQIFCAIAFSFKGICEPSLLNESIPSFRKKSDIFSKLEGIGYSMYYYFSASSAMISGYLFSINAYIPMLICLGFLVVSMILSFRFKEPKGTKEFVDTSIPTSKSFKKYVKEFVGAFKFIFKSNRLRSLILFSGVFYGVMSLMGKYEISLLNDLNISSTALGIIIAALTILSGFASKGQAKFHATHKNKSLSFIAFTLIVSCMVAAMAAMVGLPEYIAMALILIMYAIKYVDSSLFNIFISKYLGNFSDPRISIKIFTANSIAQNIGRTVVCLVGSAMLSITTTANSMFVMGSVLLIIIVVILSYMKPRVGLKSDEYSTDDIEYKE